MLEKGLSNHAGPHGGIRKRVDQNKAAGCAAICVRIEKEQLVSFDFHVRNSIHFQEFSRLSFKCVYVDAMQDAAHSGLDEPRCLLQEKRLINRKRISVKPDQLG